MKTKNILLTMISVIAINILLTGCEDKPSTDVTPTALESNATGIVQLGIIEASVVSVNSLDGHTFVNGLITNDKGEYFTDKVQIEKDIENYNPSIKFLKIIAKGGIDLDPNDDGVFVDSEKIEVLGKVVLIISVEDFLAENVHSVNLITTAISDILGDKTDMKEEDILHIANELGVEDINDDGKITMDDLIYYEMAKDESRAESYLRTTYLDSLHQNDEEAIRQFIYNIKSTQSIIRAIIKHENNTLTVKFDALSSNNYIRYSLKEGTNELVYIEYSNEEIIVPVNNALYFQECTTTGICYKEQKVLFDGTSYFIDFLNYEKVSELFTNKEELVVLQENVNNSQIELDEINEEILNLENELADLDNKNYDY